jgi:mono/diheme cytochrome c family protein
MKGSVALNLLLVLILASLIGVHWLVLPDPSRRNKEFLPDMVVSVARDAQTPGPRLADGTVVDFRPPAGSVARGMAPFGYDATPEGARLAGEELRAPAWSEDDLPDVDARGAFVFSNFCAVCHGAAGHGDGPATKRGVPPPPSFLADKALNMSDGQMYHVITLGQGNMASYASQVQRADRWKVIRYLRALQEPPQEETPPMDGAPGPGTPDTEGQEP